MKIIEDIKNFITRNGWKLSESTEEYTSYYKEGNIGIDICEKEVVFIGGYGDFKHIPITNDTVYTMIGYMLEHHIIAMDYKN